jgi:hypothetical protein
VTVLGRGTKVIAGTIKGDLTREEVERVLVDGFFPVVPSDSQPTRQRAGGLQELGLPYASDPAVSRHLAYFLNRHGSTQRPTAVLFNGGVFKAEPLRQRVQAIMSEWNGGTKVKVLHNADLDRAVCRGAAYYGLVRRGKGVRIRGGTARAYYVGVETSLPAVPGARPPIKALCLAPFGMEEGSSAEVPGQEFGLVVGEPAEFRFLGSSVRRVDTVGTMLDEWEDDIDELSPLSTTLEAPDKTGQMVPVHLQSKVTEIGTLELWCLSRDNKQRWKLEFNVREQG